VSKEIELDNLKKKLNKKIADLTLAIINGDDIKATNLSMAGLESGLSAKVLLKACYDGAKGIEALYVKKMAEKADLMLSLEAYIAAIKPFKAQLKDIIKPGTIILGAMESDGEWAATAYTLPLLKEFDHKVHLVASFESPWYIEDIRKYDPDVVCLTCVRASVSYFIKNIIDTLKQTPAFNVKNKSLYDTSTIIGCGPYFNKRQSTKIGCHKYAEGYLQLVQVVNEIIKNKTTAMNN
jgi:methanogenic corrinoid protein MtbC1